jgi:hypothetical protein
MMTITVDPAVNYIRCNCAVYVYGHKVHFWIK